MPGLGLAIDARNTRPFSISITTVTDSGCNFGVASDSIVFGDAALEVTDFWLVDDRLVC